MTTLHNNLARIAAETMLNNWKDGTWNNDIVSQNVFLGRSPSVFPSPDGAFEDPDNKLLVAIEFKPPGETKRGILTGLGQTIAYLNKFSLSYFICPEFVEGFPIGEFMKKVFEENVMNEKLPIGLIIYKNDNTSDLELAFDIQNTAIGQIKTKTLAKESRYWAKYVDTTPHLIWLLLDVAFKEESSEDRRKKIWETFFDTYYFPKYNQERLEIFNSFIKTFDGKGFLKPFSKVIGTLIKEVENNEISESEAISKIHDRIDHNFVGDNLFNSYRKNYFPFLDHLGLWDEQANLTEIGYELHKIGKLHGPTSKNFKDHLAKLILVEGKHLDLILDIEKYTRNKNFESSEEARIAAYDKLEEKGLVKKNPNRSPSESKKYFSNEMQLWTHLGILDKEGRTQFVSNKGFLFNWEEITRIISI